MLMMNGPWSDERHMSERAARKTCIAICSLRTRSRNCSAQDRLQRDSAWTEDAFDVFDLTRVAFFVACLVLVLALRRWLGTRTAKA
jgi:hypothetical protein